MAETLISPGVLARENDQSFIQGQPVQAGAAIVGPAAKGPVGIPTLVTSFSEYQAIYGGAITSGSSEYTYLSSISANNYFSQGGDSLLVTRVVSGSFTGASSYKLYNDSESGVIDTEANLVVASGGNNGVAGTYTVDATASLSGTGASLEIVASTANGKLTGSVNALFDDVIENPTDCLSGGSNPALGPISFTTNGNGVNGIAFVSITNGTVDGITITGEGSGYAAGDTITILGTSLGAETNFKCGIQESDLSVEVTAATVVNGGDNFVVGEVLSVGKDSIGNTAADLIFNGLGANDVINGIPFTLTSLSEGVIMNNAGSEVGNGALLLGSQDNIRWEVVGRNADAGTFSLLLRRGNDTHTNKSILESWTNLTLDPKSPNYIEKVIGNTSYSIVEDGVDSYVQSQGEYLNKSKYVRISSVGYKTPDYFDNAGNAKSQYTSSLPLKSSGSFNGAQGELFGADAKFYDQIDSNIQGLGELDYTSSIKLLGNKDDYRFNLLTAPGLNNSEHATATRLLVTTAETRQDCIAVIDLDGYGTQINTIISNASAFDSSYAATYWPWLQTIDPNTAQSVFVPASAMIPGVYAFTDASSDAWFAPAGLTRGALGNVTKAERKLTTTNRDSLYEANINPIATFPGNGVVVFGQKTLQKRASALDRVNVRRLLIQLKSYISQIADNLVFEQNTIATRNIFLGQVNPYLESVQQRQGLYAFKVVMDDTNNTPDVIDRNQLVGQVYIQPTRTAEFIMLDFNVLPTGAVFPE
jgi:hypothetical protein